MDSFKYNFKCSISLNIIDNTKASSKTTYETTLGICSILEDIFEENTNINMKDDAKENLMSDKKDNINGNIRDI